MKRLLLSSTLMIAALSIPRAQMRVIPLDEEKGHVALGLALRHLSNTGILLHTTAHPDDEDNGLLVMLNRGQGYRTALATATRGNGGQNEIGPEIFEASACFAPRSSGPCTGSTRRTVLHARGRLRLLLQHRRDVRKMGARRDHRR